MSIDEDCWTPGACATRPTVELLMYALTRDFVNTHIIGDFFFWDAYELRRFEMAYVACLLG